MKKASFTPLKEGLDPWISESISLSFKRQSDTLENPQLKLQKILLSIPSPQMINVHEPLVMKALNSIREFLKKNVIDVGMAFDGEIPQSLHNYWMEFERSFENIDMDKELGKDYSADLKLFFMHARQLNDELIKSS